MKIDNYLFEYNNFSMKITTLNTKSVRIEGMIKSKDQKINSFMKILVEKEEKLQRTKEELVTAQAEINNMKETIETKIGEISNWTSTDNNQDALIAELKLNIENQKIKIAAGEQEDIKDNARQEELKVILSDRDGIIATLKAYFEALKLKYQEIAACASSFEITSEETSSQMILDFKAQCMASGEYVNLEGQMAIHETTISDMKAQIETQRGLLEGALAEKLAASAQIEIMQTEIATLNTQIECCATSSATLDASMTTSFANIEVEATKLVTAQTMTSTFKSNTTSKLQEVVVMFNEIDAFVA
jgi:chromosome segregation ATPase